LNDEYTTEVGLYEDDYNLKRLKDFKDHEDSKRARLGGEFSKAFFHDNGEAVDEFGMKLTIK
jgi:hypothetical protein